MANFFRNNPVIKLLESEYKNVAATLSFEESLDGKKLEKKEIALEFNSEDVLFLKTEGRNIFHVEMYRSVKIPNKTINDEIYLDVDLSVDKLIEYIEKLYNNFTNEINIYKLMDKISQNKKIYKNYFLLTEDELADLLDEDII